jgi:hypothetical protein
MGFRVYHVREAEWRPCSLREEGSVMRGKLMFLHGFVWNDFLVSGVRSKSESSEAGEIPQRQKRRGRRSGCEVPD